VKKYKSQGKTVEESVNNKEENSCKTFVWILSKNLASDTDCLQGLCWLGLVRPILPCVFFMGGQASLAQVGRFPIILKSTHFVSIFRS
jgi:hypothetical protein